MQGEKMMILTNTDYIAKLKGIKKPDKIIKERLCPGAPCNAQGIPVILKGYNNPVHGFIGKQEGQNYRRKYQQVEPGILFNMNPFYHCF
jgi:hypothetical protein